MSIIIENIATKEFLTTTGGWSKDAVRGRAFPNAGLAFATASKESINAFNIVLFFPGTLQMVNLDHGKGIS